MIESGHILPEPSTLSAHRSVFPVGPWSTFATNDKRDLRHQLNLEQEALCIYCESELPIDDGHVEHIKSKTLNPSLTFVYKNLSHSCNSTTNCGHFKRRKLLPIEPRPGCNTFFALSEITGDISPAIGLPTVETQEATDTLSVLGLNNNPGLKRRRQQYAQSVRFLNNPADIANFLAISPFRWTLKLLS